jgi:hypothetical protein
MILILLFILILLLYLSKKEHFNVVNQHNLYTNYRNYIDDNYYNYKNTLLPQNHLYQISDNCFVDHVNRCIGNKNLCQKYSLLQCVGPPRIT